MEACMNRFMAPRCVADYLDASFSAVPDKEAYGDERRSFTYAETKEYAERIATYLASRIKGLRQPVAVYMDKSVECITMFWGILYSGNFYCPLDVEMPAERIGKIMDILKPAFILTDGAHAEEAKGFAKDAEICLWEDMRKQEPDKGVLAEIRKQVTRQDPLYVLFTSGSTGVPKGVLVSHMVIMNYLDWLRETYEYNRDDVFGNQAPLYFDVSVHDIFGAAYFGAKMEIIPPQLFSFPVRLIQYMNEKKVTTFLWVPSAMGIVARLKTFRAEKPAYLRHVMFAGEVLPRKQLDYWMSNLPDAVYANLYGPTETFVCTAYTCSGKEPEGEPMPIGKAVANCNILILDEQGKPVADGETGELCLSGSCLALGYYRNPEKTESSFVKNPVNEAWPERIYKTGDLVRIDENGDLIYVSRKDFQIKHMGYRIELGEIETAASLVDGISDCVCLYDTKRTAIVLFYDGKKRDEDTILHSMAERIPAYMLPGRIIHMTALPHNANGKIDRKVLKEYI